ncbi:class I SAM-dependent methyltransferase [soil metagenome]
MKYLLPLLLLITLLPAGCNAQPAGNTNYTYKKGSPDGIGKWYMGREIAHVMGAAGASWLERDERQQEENTALAIKNMKLTPNAVVADIGAGSGYYTFKIAPLVPQGKVYAVDIQDEMLQLLGNKKKQLNAENVTLVKSTDSTLNLPDNSIDLAIMVDVYHELEYPTEILQAVYKALKKDGKLLLIEYRGEDASVPIKPLHKTTIAQMNKEMEANNFKLFYDGEFLPIQHFLEYVKKN